MKLKEQIEFADRFWGCYERFVRVRIDGEEVEVRRILREPWKELHMVDKITITDYLAQGDSQEEREQRLSCFQKMAFASYILIWFFGRPQGNIPADKMSWELVYPMSTFWGEI